METNTSKTRYSGVIIALVLVVCTLALFNYFSSASPFTWSAFNPFEGVVNIIFLFSYGFGMPLIAATSVMSLILILLFMAYFQLIRAITLLFKH